MWYCTVHTPWDIIHIIVQLMFMLVHTWSILKRFCLPNVSHRHTHKDGGAVLGDSWEVAGGGGGGGGEGGGVWAWPGWPAAWEVQCCWCRDDLDTHHLVRTNKEFTGKLIGSIFTVDPPVNQYSVMRAPLLCIPIQPCWTLTHSSVLFPSPPTVPKFKL